MTKKLAKARLNKQSPAKNKKNAAPTTNKFIEYWNSLPNTRKHKPGTAIYNQTAHLILQLRLGEFTKSCYFSPVPPHARKIFNIDEIKTGLDNLSLLFKEGYQPENKTKLPRDLKTLLYNPRINHSMFLKYYEKPPQLIQEIDPALEEIAREQFNNTFDYENLSKRQKGTFILFLGQLRVRYRECVLKTTHGVPRASDRVLYFFPSFDKLCSEYSEWLEQFDWIEEYNVGLLSPEGKMWKRFVKEQSEELGVEL